VELPSELVDVRDLMPDALLMDASRISVTSVSTTAAFAARFRAFEAEKKANAN